MNIIPSWLIEGMKNHPSLVSLADIINGSWYTSLPSLNSESAWKQDLGSALKLTPICSPILEPFYHEWVAVRIMTRDSPLHLGKDLREEHNQWSLGKHTSIHSSTIPKLYSVNKNFCVPNWRNGFRKSFQLHIIFLTFSRIRAYLMLISCSDTSTLISIVPHLTINTDPSTCIDAFNIHACLLPLNIWIIVTVDGMAMAVAC